jgi:tetratricopeptide (TPR) repeat protein
VIRQSLKLVVFAVPLILPMRAHAEAWYTSYEKGVNAVQNQTWQNAVNFLNDAIAERSEEKANAKTYGLQFIDYFPYLYRGIAYYHLGQLDLAKNDLNKSAQSGEVRDGSKDKDASSLLDKYQQLLKAPPAIADKLSRAISSYNDADYATAITRFNEVLSLDPGNTQAKNYLAKAKEGQKSITARKAEDPGKQELAEGITAFKQNDFVAAESHFNKVLAVDRNNKEAATYLRRIRDDRDRTNNIASLYQAGVRALNNGALDDAEAKMRAILKIDRTNKDASRALQSISDRRTAAERLVKEGIALFNNKQVEPADTKFLAALAANNGNIKARDYHNRVLSSTNSAGITHLADSLIQLGITKFDAGRFREARETFRTARQSSNDLRAISYLQKLDSIEANTRAGVAAFFEGNYDKSIEALSRAVELSSKNEMSYVYLACAYGARYFLSGAEDDDLQKKAITAFRHVTELNSTYQLDRRYISPRIIALLSK